jgi:hypothetical protein
MENVSGPTFEKDLGDRESVFAITDWSPERRFLGSFRDVFAAESG